MALRRGKPGSMRHHQNKQWARKPSGGHTPHGRFYESNGPDVKIRGSASHIAEKYQQLARDAYAAGDLVATEAYHQYAEHYHRLVAEQG